MANQEAIDVIVRRDGSVVTEPLDLGGLTRVPRLWLVQGTEVVAGDQDATLRRAIDKALEYHSGASHPYDYVRIRTSPGDPTEQMLLNFASKVGKFGVVAEFYADPASRGV